MPTADKIQEIWMPPVLLDEFREKLRTVGTEVAVLGFWSRLQSTAYGLALCRTDVETHGVLLPYGIEVLATADASGSPLIVSGPPDDLEFSWMGGGRVACKEVDFEIDALTRTFRVQLDLEMFTPKSPSGVPPSEQIQRLFVDGALNLISAVALPLNDNTVVSLADNADAKTCSDLHVVKKKAHAADDWVPKEQAQGPQVQRSKKKGNKKRPRKSSGVAAAEDDQDAPTMNEVDAAPDGFPVELVPLCGPPLGPTEGVSTPLFEADADGSTVCPAHLDGLMVMDKDAPLASVADAIVATLKGQSRAFEAALTQLPTAGSGASTAALVAHHFKPSQFGSTLTLLKRSDEDESSHASVEVRRALHESLFLPADRPIFRRACAYEPILGDGGEPSMIAEDGRIICPHRGLPDPGTGATAKVYMVEGSYAYYHYMQDKFNDNGWGCAYRSLQTIVSWCRFQRYTDVGVPTHREVQTLLVKIGDKPSTFIGSKEWIGANEVCYVLDTLCSISSKIMFVGSGAELESKGRELARHFSTEGTPIMVGGGVLAYTILGVMFNEVTGATRFLILDPHYTGGEDLAIIQNKGWIGWKGGDLFRKDAFYNLCMPMRPKVL